MFARLLVIVCLFQFGLCIGRSEPVGPSDLPVVVYLKAVAKQPVDAILAMKREINDLMRPVGYTVEFREINGRRGDEASSQIVILSFDGVCDGAETTKMLLPGTRPSLATTAVSDGHVLPFSILHCKTISQMLAPTLVNFSYPVRRQMLGRSLGRIVAHELYHVLADETSHVGEGVAKSAFSVNDLLASRFEFEGRALLKMHPVLVAGHNSKGSSTPSDVGPELPLRSVGSAGTPPAGALSFSSDEVTFETR